MRFLNKKEFKIFLTFFIIYLCFARFQWSDDDTKLDLTRAIVDERRLEIDSYINNTGDRAYYNGHYYSDKPPGASLLTIPVYVVFKFFFGVPNTDFKLNILKFIIITFSSVLFSALLVVLMYKISRFFVKKEYYRNIITIIFGLCTLMFIYSSIYYHHSFSTFFGFLSFYLILKMVKEKRKSHYFIAGLCLGLAIAIDYLSLILFPPLVLFLIFKKKYKESFAFIFGLLILCTMITTYNFLIFNNHLDCGYVHIDQELNNNNINKYDENLVELWNQKNQTVEYINFEPLFKPNEFVCAYALTYIYSPDNKSVQIRSGSDDTIEIWLNNRQILENYHSRRAIINQDITNQSLKKGFNKILVKVCNQVGYFEFYFTITDMKGMICNDINYSCFNQNIQNQSLKNLSKKDKWLVIGPFDYEIQDNIFLEKQITLNNLYQGKNQLVAWEKYEENKKAKKVWDTVVYNSFGLLKRGFSDIFLFFNISSRILVYPYRGLFFYSPILFLSLIGLFFMYKKDKPLTFLTILIFLSFILIISSLDIMWWQGSSFGPRFSVVIIPFLMLPLMFIIKKINKKILLFLILICIFINLLGMQEFEQDINQGGDSFAEITANTINKYGDSFYAMKPVGNPLFTYYLPLSFRYGPRSILIEEILGFRIPPFLNMVFLLFILFLIWVVKPLKNTKNL